MAFATSSFPVPLSPVTSTVLLVRADNLDHLEELLHLLLLPTRLPIPWTCLKLAAKIGVLFAEATILQRAVHNQLEFFDEVLGFDDVVEAPIFRA